MSRIHILLLFVVVLALTACGSSGSGSQAAAPAGTSTPAAAPVQPSGPSKADIEGLDVVEALALANRWKGNDVTTFVDTRRVAFEFKNGDKVSVDLPEDEMVVAIAPYVTRTHPCEIHYMSGCQGELVDVPVAVKATLPDGTVLVDETIRTMSNGFLELWLPRNVEIALTMAAEGKAVSGTISTFAGSNTCVTTLQLI